MTSTLLFLAWQPAAAAPGGAAQVQLATFQAVKAFLPRRAARHLARIARRARSHYRRETIGTNVAVFLSLATRAHRDSVLTLERDSRDRAGC